MLEFSFDIQIFRQTSLQEEPSLPAHAQAAKASALPADPEELHKACPQSSDIPFFDGSLQAVINLTR